MSERQQPSFDDEAATQFRAAHQLNLDQEIKAAAAPVENRVYSAWQSEFASELGRLQERIQDLQNELARESERTGDRMGTGHEFSLEGETDLRLQLQGAKMDRVKLIEQVPVDHREEAARVRKDLGILLESDPI